VLAGGEADAAERAQRPPPRRPPGQRRERLLDVPGGGGVAGQRLGLGELQQDRAAPLRRRRLDGGAGEQPGRGGRVALGDGARGGLAQGREDPGVGVGPGRQQVGGDLAQRRAVGGEQVGGLAVGAGAGEVVEVGADRGGDQRVGEADRLAAGEDAGDREGVGGALGRRRVDLGEGADLAQRRAVAEDRGGGGDRLGRLAEPAELGEQRVHHGLGDEGAHGGDRVGGRRDRFDPQHAAELDQHEGVAGRDIATGGDELVVGLRQLGAEEGGDRVRAERAGPYRATGGAAQRRERVGGDDRRAGADGEEDRDRRFRGACREVGEEGERGSVAPLHVVDQYGQPGVSGKVDREPVERPQEGRRVG
jgi:hypothetical protein